VVVAGASGARLAQPPSSKASASHGNVGDMFFFI
jgi:hypothetical protein